MRDGGESLPHIAAVRVVLVAELERSSRVLLAEADLDIVLGDLVTAVLAAAAKPGRPDGWPHRHDGDAERQVRVVLGGLRFVRLHECRMARA